MKQTILVVDDEHAVADTLATMLDRVGYSSIAVYSAAEGLKVLETTQPALIISDVMMPGMNGIEFAIEAGKVCPKAKLLLISGNAATQEMLESACLHGHPFYLMAKPVPPRQLLAAVAAMLKEVASLSDYGLSLVVGML